MTDSFELDMRGLRTYLESLGLEDAPQLPVQAAIAVWSDEERFLSANLTVVLAQLTYLLGISPHVARPDDFPAHSLLGLSGTFHGDRDMFFILLSSAGGPYSCSEDSATLDRLQVSSDPQGFRLVELLSEAILGRANRLIPSARAAVALVPDPTFEDLKADDSRPTP